MERGSAVGGLGALCRRRSEVRRLRFLLLAGDPEERRLRVVALPAEPEDLIERERHGFEGTPGELATGGPAEQVPARAGLLVLEPAAGRNVSGRLPTSRR